MAYLFAIFYEFCLKVLKDLDWSVAEDCMGCTEMFFGYDYFRKSRLLTHSSFLYVPCRGKQNLSFFQQHFCW